MTYQLKGGEEVRNGKLYGWTGHDCSTCKGTGENNDDIPSACKNCGGTGEEWGLMPEQPTDLP